MAIKFGQGMARDDPKVELEGHRSKVKVIKSEIVIIHCSHTGYEIKVKVTWVKVRGHLGQSQRSLGLRSKVTLVIVRQNAQDIGRWAHIKVKLHFVIEIFRSATPFHLPAHMGSLRVLYCRNKRGAPSQIFKGARYAPNALK